MSYKLKRGYFSEVNGTAVTRKPLPLSTTSFAEGYPTGILFHYTVGCNDDISPTLRSKNFGATFNVGHRGGIFQYRPLLKPSWHAYDASRYYVGIEHTSLGPGSTCQLTYPPLVVHNTEARVLHPRQHLASERCWRCFLTLRPRGYPDP